MDVGQFDDEEFFRILITLSNGSQVVSNARFTSVKEASDFWTEMSKTLGLKEISLH